MRGFAAFVVLLLAMPAVMAQDAPRTVHVVNYHIDPDPRRGEPDADPFSSPRAPLPAALASGSAVRLPVTRIDGVFEADGAPEGDPTSVPAHFREIQRLVLARSRMGSPATLIVDGERAGSTWTVTARALDAPPGTWNITATLVEDALTYEGGSGVRVHRFVARDVLARTEGTSAAWNVTLDPAWDLSRLSLIVALRTDADEVLQSARWAVGGAAVRQTSKAILLEHATATWCTPCGPTDEAIQLIASQFGGARIDATSTGGYLRTPSAITWLAVVAGASVAWFAMRRRAA